MGPLDARLARTHCCHDTDRTRSSRPYQHRGRPMTKIMATACCNDHWNGDGCRAAIAAGASEFRVSSSYGEVASHARLARRLRAASGSVGGTVRVFYDVNSGTKVRCSNKEPLSLEVNE